MTEYEFARTAKAVVAIIFVVWVGWPFLRKIISWFRAGPPERMITCPNPQCRAHFFEAQAAWKTIQESGICPTCGGSLDAAPTDKQPGEPVKPPAEKINTIWTPANAPRNVLIACAVAALLAILFPYWVEDNGAYSIRIGYGFLFAPPKSDYSHVVDARTIDTARTALTLCAIALVAAVAAVLHWKK